MRGEMEQVAEQRKKYLERIDEMVFEYRRETHDPKDGLDRIRQILQQWQNYEEAVLRSRGTPGVAIPTFPPGMP